MKESMRLLPPIVMFWRTNELPEGALDLLGKTIPSGAHLAQFVFGLQRDPTYWERAEEFLPERFLPVSASQ